MFVVFFSIIVLLGIFTICAEFVMRIRLTARATDKMAWWRRGGDEIAAMYQELFPNSKLPIVREFVFWFLLMSAGVVLVLVFWKSD